MTASLAYDPVRMTGYRQDQLAAAFDRVRNERDWHGPISAVIRQEDRMLVEWAVYWFTGTTPTFMATGQPGQLAVSAPGYRQGPAGVRSGR